MNAVEQTAEIVAAVLMLAGSLFSLLAAFGVLRLPDVYTRAHAATKSSTLGVMCMLVGAIAYFWLADGHFSMKLLLGVIFVFVTAPVAGQMMMRAAHRTGVPLWEGSAQDELKPLHEEQADAESGKPQRGATES